MDVEVAPTGTKALLTEIAKHLRRDEAMLKDRLDDEENSAAVRIAITEEMNRAQRLVGKVDAILAGWEE